MPSRVALLSCLLFALFAPVSTAQELAPRDRPGPALTEPAAALDAALTCSPDLATAPGAPVLLVPGTGERPDLEYGWNYEPALRATGRAVCLVTIPTNGLQDIQTSAEYLVHAIRTMHRAAGERIAIVGHSQGGMSPRWALRFWPDTRPMVEDLVGLASSNHGTTAAQGKCTAGCGAAEHQQKDTSRFIAALNAGGETFAGVDYTSVYTRLDQVVLPNQDAATGSTALRTGEGARTNVATQDVCPGNTAEHLSLGTTDPVGYALALDALANPGPAVPDRVPPTVCAQLALPGVDPVAFGPRFAANVAEIGRSFTVTPQLAAEPPLRCFVFAGPCVGVADGATVSNAPLPRVVSPAIRATKAGLVRLKVRCFAACADTVVLSRNGRTIGRRAFRASGPRTVVVPVRLSRAAQRSLRRTGRQRVRAAVGSSARTMVVGRPPQKR